MDKKEFSQTLTQLEDQMIDKIEILRSMKLKEDQWINEYIKNHKNYSNTGKLCLKAYPKYCKNLSYYPQFWKTYLVNQMLIHKIKEMSNDNKISNKYITQLQELQKQHAKISTIKNQKKKRRTSSQILKNFKCPYNVCDKYYGCDVSMNLHIKIKHNGGNKTQRQKLAICVAQQKGMPLPQITLNFPPGYLQQFRQMYYSQKQ